MGGQNGNPQASGPAPGFFAGANAGPSNSMTTGANGVPQVTGLPSGIGPSAPMVGATSDYGGGPAKPSSMNPNAAAAMQALFGKLAQPQGQFSPAAAPVTQVGYSQYQAPQAPSTGGNYPNTSMVRRGQFGSR